MAYLPPAPRPLALTAVGLVEDEGGCCAAPRPLLRLIRTGGDYVLTGCLALLACPGVVGTSPT